MSETVVGTLAGITEKPTGWIEIEVALPGKQYPVRMATKKQALVELARAAGTNVMAWTFNAVESEKINPNNNKPYTDRYFEGVAPVDTSSYVADVVERSPQTDGMTPEKWDAKERRDYRSRAWAQTIAALGHTIKVEEDPVEVFKRLQPFQRKVYVDVTGTFAFPADEEDIPF